MHTNLCFIGCKFLGSFFDSICQWPIFHTARFASVHAFWGTSQRPAAADKDATRCEGGSRFMLDRGAGVGHNSAGESALPFCIRHRFIIRGCGLQRISPCRHDPYPLVHGSRYTMLALCSHISRGPTYLITQPLWDLPQNRRISPTK